VAFWAGWPALPDPAAEDAIRRVAGCTVATLVLSRNPNNVLAGLFIPLAYPNEIGRLFGSSPSVRASVAAQIPLLVLG
jgi:hypothetical protein